MSLWIWYRLKGKHWFNYKGLQDPSPLDSHPLMQAGSRSYNDLVDNRICNRLIRQITKLCHDGESFEKRRKVPLLCKLQDLCHAICLFSVRFTLCSWLCLFIVMVAIRLWNPWFFFILFSSYILLLSSSPSIPNSFVSTWSFLLLTTPFPFKNLTGLCMWATSYIMSEA